MANTITITLSVEKTTKNTVKFVEKTANEFTPEKIGTLYIPKATLAAMEYTGGNIVAKIEVQSEENEMLFVEMKKGAFMEPEKATKNTVKFNEQNPMSEFVPDVIGSVYVPKYTLAELGYTGGKIAINLSKE